MDLKNWIILGAEIALFFGGIMVIFPIFGTWITFVWCAFMEIIMILIWDYQMARFIRKLINLLNRK